MKFEKITGDQLKKYLNVESKFEVSGDKGLYSDFLKTLKTPTVNSKVENGEKVTTSSYPEAVSTAKTMAKEATQDHSAVYWAIGQLPQELKLDPEDESNYTNPEVLAKVEKFVYDDLIAKAPTGTVKEANYDEANHQLKVQGVTIDLGRLSVAQATAKLAQLKYESETNTDKTNTTTSKLNANGIKMNAKYKADPANNGEDIPMYLAEFGGGVDKVTVSSTKKKTTPKQNTKTKPTETAAARAKRIANGG